DSAVRDHMAPRRSWPRSSEGLRGRPFESLEARQDRVDLAVPSLPEESDRITQLSAHLIPGQRFAGEECEQRVGERRDRRLAGSAHRRPCSTKKRQANSVASGLLNHVCQPPSTVTKLVVVPLAQSVVVETLTPGSSGAELPVDGHPWRSRHVAPRFSAPV